MPWNDHDEHRLAALLNVMGDLLYGEDDGIEKARALVLLLGGNPDITTQDLSEEIDL